MAFEFANTTISGALTSTQALTSEAVNLVVLLLTAAVIVGALVFVYTVYRKEMPANF
jgi:hypothetical protein